MEERETQRNEEPELACSAFEDFKGFPVLHYPFMPLWHMRYVAVIWWCFFSKETFHCVGQSCSPEVISGLEMWSGEQTTEESSYHLHNTVVTGQRNYRAAEH